MNKKGKVPQIKEYLHGEKVEKSAEQTIVDVKHIEHVGHQIRTDHSTMFLIKNINTDVVPCVGDIIVFYTILCSQVVGVELNGKLLYFH